MKHFHEEKMKKALWKRTEATIDMESEDRYQVGRFWGLDTRNTTFNGRCNLVVSRGSTQRVNHVAHTPRNYPKQLTGWVRSCIALLAFSTTALAQREKEEKSNMKGEIKGGEWDRKKEGFVKVLWTHFFFFFPLYSPQPTLNPYSRLLGCPLDRAKGLCVVICAKITTRGLRRTALGTGPLNGCTLMLWGLWAASRFQMHCKPWVWSPSISLKHLFSPGADEYGFGLWLVVTRAGNALTAPRCCLSKRESLDFFTLVSFPELTLLMALS